VESTRLRWLAPGRALVSQACSDAIDHLHAQFCHSPPLSKGWKSHFLLKLSCVAAAPPSTEREGGGLALVFGGSST
jgi:hypothetical protein